MTASSGHAKVSVILVNYGAAERTRQAAAALLASTRVELQVIVVDNASPPSDSDALTRLDSRVTLIQNPRNEGFAAGCNRGAVDADGDYLLFMNPDVEVTESWLEILVEALEADESIGVLAPSSLYPGERRSRSNAVRDTATVPGCALVVRSIAWEQLGGFDNAFFLYWEDTDLCWRAWLSGWRVCEHLGSVVYHDRGGTGGGRAWASEQIRNGVYTHLKLMRVPLALTFCALALVRTIILSAKRRDVSVWLAWGWNIRQLPATWRKRRAILAVSVNRGRLEALVISHRLRMLRERRTLARPALSPVDG